VEKQLDAARSAGAGRGFAGPVDIVVVGAGFAGLTTARRLVERGASVVVLEADDRVGGRTMPGTLAGHTVDLGGQWVGPTQFDLLKLAEEFQVKTSPQYVDGRNIMDVAGRQVRHGDGIAMLEPDDLAEYRRVTGMIDELTQGLEPTAPWTSPSAAALDAQTVETWIGAATPSEPARALYRCLTRGLCSVESGQISMLYFVNYAAAGGGLASLLGMRGGAQDSVFDGGVWQLAAKLADGLGDRIVLNSPVQAIRQDADAVQVSTAAGSWTAKYVVVTAPPAMAARIDYEPPLPALRDSLTQRMPLGSVIKVLLAYETPFWREEGLSGLITSDRIPSGPWMDKSFPGSSMGGLVGFFDGGPAQVWADRPAAARRAQVLDDLATYLGDRARHPVDYAEQVWPNARWQRGGYVSVPGPGVLTAFGPALTAPVGRIHWAGTETSDRWIGYIDGAIRSGERVAATLGALLPGANHGGPGA
jgi:monoamine oxidase